jgi:hypothetical protein
MTGSSPSAAIAPRTIRPSARRILALIAMASLAVAACGGSAALLSTVGSPVDRDAGELPAGMPSAAPAAPEGAGGEATGGEAYAPGDTNATDGPLIVRTGQLDLQVAVLDDALRAAENAVTAAGGYVAASQRQGDGDTAGAMVTYRIPAERWDATLAALRAVGTKVLAERTASEEVTSQVVDLGARLVNLRATEAALQAIMTKATKIPDILEVQSQLAGVRQEIERLAAQKLSLEKQAALATLTVGFALPPVVAVTLVQEGWDPAGEVDQAAATLVGLGQGVVIAVIWVVIVLLPLALVLGIVLAVAWLVVRRFRPRATPPAPGAPLDVPAT